MDEAGEKIELAIALAEVFGGQIDFQQRSAAGRLLRASVREVDARRGVRRLRPDPRRAVRERGREHQAFRWVNPSTGKAGLLRREGPVAQTLLLKSPLKFEPRVTSGFSRRRLHPVHHVVRAHLGVDYAAPHGRRGRRGGGRRRGLGRLGRWRRQTGPPPSQRRTRELLPAPLVVWQGRSRRRARRAGAVDRPRRRDRHGDRSAPRLPAPPERDVRRSAARTCEAAARRADSGCDISRHSGPSATA